MRKMCERLATVGPTKDGEIKICVIGIRQRIHELRNPTLDYKVFGRLRAECALFWNRIERHIERQPKVKAGRDCAKENKAAATEWRTRTKPKIKRLIAAEKRGHESNSRIADRVVNEDIESLSTKAGVAFESAAAAMGADKTSFCFYEPPREEREAA